MTSGKNLPSLDPSELLGRGVFSSGSASRWQKGRRDHDTFLQKEGVDDLSVDRLDHASPEVMAEIGDRVAAIRSRRFYGWAVLSVEKASEQGRTVEATPLLANRYHADIHLNISAVIERRDAQHTHALALVAVAAWRARPQAPPTSSGTATHPTEPDLPPR